MLGVASEAENLAVMESFSAFLITFGQRLLPKVGAEPLGSLQRARPEVQELSMLLAFLPCPASVQEKSTPPPVQDPWVTFGDPWQAERIIKDEVGAPTIEGHHSDEVGERNSEVDGMVPTDVFEPHTVDSETTMDEIVAKTRLADAVCLTLDGTTFVNAFTQTDLAHEDEVRLQTIQGPWDLADTVYVKDVIEV